MFESTGPVLTLPPVLRELVPDIEGSAIVELLSPEQAHVRQLGDEHPLVLLHGDDAPDDVAGLAVIASGRVIAGVVRNEADGPGGLDAGTAIQVVHLLWRDGVSHTALLPDPASVAAGTDVPLRAVQTAVGLIPDALRRVLGLATEPADRDPLDYWFLAWLCALPFSATRAIDALGWHPAIDPRELDPALDPETVTSLAVGRLVDHARATGWEGVRRSAAAGWLEVGTCEPELAAWFDAGSFARWLGSGLVDPWRALELLMPAMSGELVRLFATVHDVLGLDR